jgi:hypothetical protein
VRLVPHGRLLYRVLVELLVALSGLLCLLSRLLRGALRLLSRLLRGLLLLPGLHGCLLAHRWCASGW